MSQSDRVATSRRPRTPVLAAIAYTACVSALDLGAVVLAGLVLWSTGRSNVVDGTVPGQVGFIVTLVFGIAVRGILTDRIRGHHPTSEQALVMVSAGVRIVVAGGLIAAFLSTRVYYLGWLGVLATLILLIDSALRFLVAAVVPTRGPRSIARRRGRAVRPALVGLGAAIVGLVLTGRIHQWDPVILNGLVLLIGAAILLGRVVGLLLTSWAAKAPANPRNPPHAGP